MEDEVRFLYSVFPKKPIKGVLEDGRPISSRKSLNLTIDQVRLCMNCGSVYRWFANDGNRLERVTALNIERLHNEKFMTEEEFKSSKFDAVSSSTGSVVETKEEDSKVEEKKVEEPAPVVEEKKEEEVVAEPVVEEAPAVEEVAAPVEEAKEEETVAEEAVEESAEAEVVTEEKKDGNPNPYNGNYKKKKH